MAQAESHGYGITLDYDKISEATLRAAIDEIFNNTKYRENAERMSERFKDNPINAIDKAVWYVEHVINANGAHHLRTAKGLSFIEIYLLDQLLLVFLLFIIKIIVISKLVRLVRMKFQKRSKSSHAKMSIKGTNKFKSN
jgi:glucuronosyltransferase